MSNMIYKPEDKPLIWYEWILYPIQMLLAVFVATVLIAKICGTPISACLIGAGIGTLIYQAFTKFKSPMFISSCGATCSAVIGALALGNGGNYLAVAVGGVVIFAVYLVFSVLTKIFGKKIFEKIFPVTIIGSITMVIGLNLAGFLPTYIGTDTWSMVVALLTMFVTAVVSHYGKGFMKTVAFLIGLLSGYLVALLLTVTNVSNLVSFGELNSFVSLPDFAFTHWGDNSFNFDTFINVLILFVPVSICAVLEHYSDHKCLSNIIESDLTTEPGVHRTLLGDGFASMMGTFVCGLPNTSYGESVATIGFSKVSSVIVSTISAVILCVLAFLTPVRVFLESIPSCVFGGCAMILYGYIISSGLKLLINNKTDLENNKNVIIVSVILTIGVSGIFLFSNSFTGVSLAMVVGVILNLILREHKK